MFLMNYLQNKGDLHMAQNETPIILDETEQKIINIIDSHRDQIIDFAKDIDLSLVGQFVLELDLTIFHERSWSANQRASGSYRRESLLK